MKKGNTMRRVAGVIYLVSFLAELYLMRPIYSGASLMYLPISIFLNVLVILGAGAAAVWLLCSDKLVGATAGRAVVVATALAVLKTLVFYDFENSLMSDSMATVFPGLAGSNMWNYVFIILRLILLIVAAFFVLNAGEQKPAADDEESEEGETEADLDAIVDELEALEETAGEADEEVVVEIDEETLPGNDR